jgi:hypothetical protein
MVVFAAMLIMRYTPGWVLNGVIAEDVEVVEDVDVRDDVAVEVAEEDTKLVVCCCGDVEMTCVLCDAEIPPPTPPPPTPPPIAAPNTTSTSTNAIQNVRVENPHMRGLTSRAVH